MADEKTAFLFPGQGRLPDRFPVDSDVTERLLRVAEGAGLALQALLEEKDADRLTQTEFTQPILLIDSLARNERLRSAGWTPNIAAGHSLGEYAALVCAGSLDAEDALRIVIERGRLMSDVRGGMTAILKLPLETVRSLCEAVGKGVCVANRNAPTQVVVSGEPAALEEVASRAIEAGGRAIPLRVSGPFHSPAMLGAQRALEASIINAPLSAPRFPVVSGVTGSAESNPTRLRELLCRQMTAPVQWVGVVTHMKAAGVTRAIEVGSGDVLTRLGRQIHPEIRFITYQEAIDEGI